MEIFSTEYMILKGIRFCAILRVRRIDSRDKLWIFVNRDKYNNCCINYIFVHL